MSDLPDALATPIEWNIGGRTIMLARLTGNDLAKFEERAKVRRGRIALEALTANALPSEVAQTRKDMMREMLFSQESVSWISELASFQGVADILYLAARKLNPEITEQEVGELLTFVDFNAATDLAMKVAYGGPLPQEDDAANPPAPSRKARRRSPSA